MADEDIVANLVEGACELNKRCAARTYSSGQLHEYGGFSVDLAKLESAIAAPFQGFGGVPRFPTSYERAAAIIINIAKGHPFADGNKRTALGIGLVYLEVCSIKVLPPSPMEGAQLVVEAVTSNVKYDTLVSQLSTRLFQWS